MAGEGSAALRNRLIHENELYFGQNLDNDYVRTKFLAERALLEAVSEKRLDGCIIRVGNLMSRHSDGEFQINFITNGFMRSLKAYRKLGMFPVTSMEHPAEFSPIDSTAQAILEFCPDEDADAPVLEPRPWGVGAMVPQPFPIGPRSSLD